MVLPTLLETIYSKTQERKNRVESIGLSLVRYISENSSFDPDTELYTNNTTSEGAKNRLKLESNRILTNHYGVDMGALDMVEREELYNTVINPIWLPDRESFERNPSIDALYSLIKESTSSSTKSLANTYYDEIVDSDSYHANIEEYVDAYTDPNTTLEEKIKINQSYGSLIRLCLENGIDPTDGGRVDISQIR